MAYLEIRIGQEVRRISLDRDHLRIGRLAENDIVLRDAQISRQHAELRFMSGVWRIMDIGSTNGLHFKGKRVREHLLTSGDVLLLAPNTTLCFRDGATPPDVISTAAAPAPTPTHRPQPPVAPVAPVAPAQPVERSMFDLLHPRSPFADDEQLYVPPGMGIPAPPTDYNRQHRPVAAASPPASSAYSQGSAPFPDMRPSQFDTIPSGGYPAPVGPLTSGSDGQDPFRRSSINAKAETAHKTGGPTSTLLHVCQTCGQLTTPDSVYCQNCHHSIARECANCRLSLLPIQDRCPRCQTPNPGSVRRAHRTAGA
jgi:predicted component of type VI protein secretion system